MNETCQQKIYHANVNVKGNKRGITINVDASVKGIIYVKKIILLQVLLMMIQ